MSAIFLSCDVNKVTVDLKTGEEAVSHRQMSLSPKPLTLNSVASKSPADDIFHLPTIAITCTSTANSISSPPPPHHPSIPNGSSSSSNSFFQNPLESGPSLPVQLALSPQLIPGRIYNIFVPSEALTRF